MTSTQDAQVYDFAEKMLAGQREFATSLAAHTAAGTEAARQHTESVVGAVKQQAATAADALNGTAPTTK